MLLKETNIDLESEGPLFCMLLKSGYGKARMGVNYLALTGKLLVTELSQEDSEAYTGSCFKQRPQQQQM